MNIRTLEQVSKDMENGTYNMTDNGKCTQCGNCCSNILPMTNKEIDAICKYIKRYHIKEFKHRIPFANPIADMSCPFLNTDKNTKRCMIYEVRPNICRQFSCDPQQRPILDVEYRNKANIVNVREKFYGIVTLQDG